MELNLTLPQGNFILKNSAEKKDFVIAAAGGRKPELSWFKKAACGRKIYCADRGIEICFDAGFKPELLCGDADSASQAYLQKAKDEKIKALLFNPAKDDTDLQLLLNNLPLKSNLLITGIWGGRFDHLYSNVFSLCSYKKRTNTAVIMADEQELMVLLAAGESLEFTACDDFKALSLIPLENSCVSLSGTRWPLKKAELLISNPYAISNEITSEVVKMSCHSGFAGFYLKTAGRELL